MTADVGAVIGPVAAGILAQQVSYGAAFAVTGAVMLLVAVPWALAPRPARKPTVTEATEI